MKTDPPLPLKRASTACTRHEVALEHSWSLKAFIINRMHTDLSNLSHHHSVADER